MINKTLAIIAGGKSSRMGEDKASLIFRDKTFIENIIEASKDFEEVIIISKNKELINNKDIRIISDIYEDCGPMGGIYTALENSKNNKVLCVACDMPLIKKETLNLIGSINEEYEVLIPKIEDREQPLCAVYSKDILNEMKQSILKKDFKLNKFIKDREFKIIEEEFTIEEFLNINTKKDYRGLKEYDVYSRNNNK